MGKGSAMKHYNAPYNSLMHARPTMHCIPLVYLYIYMVRTYSVYIHPAPFVRDAIFPHCMLVNVTTVAQEKRLAGQKG